ncbi:hypothetical protein [Mucilaginibacter sp. CSA2-8R]|uniref:hypothetical protein n=1 Tax=Mucilaginibacter sp. CSA2-8R TaxID=3141542 RepID=UPI00315D5200
MSLNNIKCPNCQHWNSADSKADQRCSLCDALLDSRQVNRESKSTDHGFSFTDSLPPYARYVFLAIVAAISLVIVIAFA